MGVRVPAESYSEWQFRVDIWFNARMKPLETVFFIVRYPLFVVLSTVQFVSVIGYEEDDE